MTSNTRTRRTKFSRLLMWCPSVVALMLIIYLTFQSPQDTTLLSRRFQQWLIGLTGSNPPEWMKNLHTVRSLAHVPEYLVLGSCIYLGMTATVRYPGRFTVLIGAVFGLLDEGIKYLLPTREFDPGDWGLDVAGVLLAVVLCCCLRWLISRVHEDSSRA